MRSGSLLCFLFDLAPNGVYPAPAVTLGAVGSYPTFSPFLWQARVVCFLWHFPFRTISHTDSRVNPGTFYPVESGLSSSQRDATDTPCLQIVYLSEAGLYTILPQKLHPTTLAGLRASLITCGGNFM